MTGYVTAANGAVWQLPQLLQWEALRTDGSSCDSAWVRFPLEPDKIATLRSCLRLRLEEDGETVFYGVVDEVAVDCGQDGSAAEISARGLMALMMDSQLREAAFYTFQESDAVALLAAPFGVDKVERGGLPAVRNFSWGTGTSPWTALCGYCRHAAGVQPRFSAEGSLILKKAAGCSWELTQNCGLTELQFRQRCYGIIGRQIVVQAGGGQEIAENPAFLALGGNTQKVAMRTGSGLKASWRTAKQRVEDSMDEAAILTVTLPGDCKAEPGDTVFVDLPQFPGRESFAVRSVKRVCGKNGRQTVLEMKGGLG